MNREIGKKYYPYYENLPEEENGVKGIFFWCLFLWACKVLIKKLIIKIQKIIMNNINNIQTFTNIPTNSSAVTKNE